MTCDLRRAGKKLSREITASVWRKGSPGSGAGPSGRSWEQSEELGAE